MRDKIFKKLDCEETPYVHRTEHSDDIPSIAKRFVRKWQITCVEKLMVLIKHSWILTSHMKSMFLPGKRFIRDDKLSSTFAHQKSESRAVFCGALLCTRLYSMKIMIIILLYYVELPSFDGAIHNRNHRIICIIIIVENPTNQSNVDAIPLYLFPSCVHVEKFSKFW